MTPRSLSLKRWFSAVSFVFSCASCLGSEEEMLAEEVEAAQSTVGRSQAALVSSCAESTPIQEFQELMIVHPSVVESAEARNDTGPNGGPLSFHGVMTKLANTSDPARVADFTESWLRSFAQNQTVNGFQVTARTGAVSELLDPNRNAWPRVNGKLDMTRAPFRLLAVANRMDLMGTGPGKQNGEARLVYGITVGSPPLMTVIFEFNLPGERSLRTWATRWHKLGSVPFGPEFNQLLVSEVVSKFVAPQNLSQLRTNERLFSFPWNMREFKLDLATSTLVHTTVKQTPDASHNGANATRTAELLTWLRANANDVVSNTHVIPDRFLGGDAIANTTTFGGGPTDNFRGARWLINNNIQPRIDEPLRAAFASQTCGGCHNSDVPGNAVSSVAPFYHVDPRDLVPGFPGNDDGTARLSRFVKEQEIPLRKQVLSSLLSCKCVATYKVLSRTASGTQSAVSLRNISGARVNSWDVSFKYAASERVTAQQNAVPVPQSDASTFKFKNASHNAFMEAGEQNTRTFTFSTSYDPNVLNPVPRQLITNCQ